MKEVLDDMLEDFRRLNLGEKLFALVGYAFVLLIACPAMLLFCTKILGCLFLGDVLLRDAPRRQVSDRQDNCIGNGDDPHVFYDTLLHN